jgi:hypothetical protein
MGLSPTTDKQKEAAWRVEFEATTTRRSITRRFVGFPNGTAAKCGRGRYFL